jgi:hypothetical protein
MLNAHVLCTTAWDVLLADSAASVTGATRLAASRAGAAWHLRLGAAAAGAPPRRHFSSDGMNERHVQLLGLRMDALKQNKLSGDDLQATFEQHGRLGRPRLALLPRAGLH